MFSYKTLVRDKLIADATVKGLFSAAASGSCRINMENLVLSAAYPQILIGWGGGQTTPNMDGDEGVLNITIECRGTGSVHGHQEVGKFRSAILNVIDDTSISNSTAVCYHIRKISEEDGYDEEEKVYWSRMNFTTWYKQNFNVA